MSGTGRTLALAILGGCASAHPPPAPLSATAPPAPSLSPRPLYLMVVRGAQPSCERWDLADDPRDGPVLRRGDVTIGLIASPGALAIDWASSGDYTIGCSYGGATRALADGGLGVGDAEWFGTADACAQAIADARPVATDLAACGPTAPAYDSAATFAAFDAILAQGGALWAIDGDTCSAWQVHDSTVTARRGDQTLVWRYDLTYSHDAYIAIDEPQECNIATILFSPTPGAVAVPGGIVYVDRSACEGELENRAHRATWGPPLAPPPPARLDRC